MAGDTGTTGGACCSRISEGGIVGALTCWTSGPVQDFSSSTSQAIPDDAITGDTASAGSTWCSRTSCWPIIGPTCWTSGPVQDSSSSTSQAISVDRIAGDTGTTGGACCSRTSEGEIVGALTCWTNYPVPYFSSSAACTDTSSWNTGGTGAYKAGGQATSWGPFAGTTRRAKERSESVRVVIQSWTAGLAWYLLSN